MEALLLYICQVNLFFMLFYLIYIVFLRKETYFRLNRFFLLFGLLFSIAIPFVSLPDFAGQQLEASGIVETTMPYLVQLGEQTSKPLEKGANLVLWVGSIYAFGVLFIGLRFLKGIRQILLLVKRNHKVKRKGYWLVETSQLHEPFSFLNYLFWSKSSSLDGSDAQRIKKHELAHIKQMHTVDVLLLEIFHALFWYNPIIIAYKISLRNIHEYLADDSTVGLSGDKTSYSELLLGQFLQSRSLYLTSQFFNQSTLKSRIMMLHKSKSRKIAMLRVLWVLPVLAICLIMHACSEKALEPITKDASKYTKIKTYNLSNANEEYQLVLSKGTKYKAELENLADVSIEFVNEKGEVIASNKDGSIIKFEVKETAIYKMKAMSTNGSAMKGEIDLSFARDKVAVVEKTKDGFPLGFNTIARNRIGGQKSQEFKFDVVANESISFMLVVEAGNTDGIIMEVKRPNGELVARNFFNDNYFADMTLKCRETEQITLTVTQSETSKQATLLVAEKRP